MQHKITNYSNLNLWATAMMKSQITKCLKLQVAMNRNDVI